MLKKLIFCLGLLLCSVIGFAQEFPPKSNTLVTDFTNTLTQDQKQQLENKLVAFDDSTTTQIAVVIMKSTGGYDINEYAALLGRKWGVGSKDKNNGIIVLVAKDDRKVAIQTGYGAEGAVPDGVTHDIIYNDILPQFKADDYYAGLDKATDQLIKFMKGEYKAEPKAKKSKGNGKAVGGSVGLVIIIVIFVLILIFRNRGGGGGSIIGSRGGASPFWWFLAGSMMNSGNRGGGGWGGFSGGGGGSSGGGGGFGGFGGGSFGGGGSSGSW
ncbi:TPM domain-containing protein [Mucilaginibacter myungsuensis]|uniref:TPM domain-containing protein n=1 Tax=Mucilaginibacter myungsuensis TaxID=649104 RepID=A0A929PWZ2_9SPHI|nr:TPM domain-containing protein [Mucilaginibacter myungsuensis]MBE9661687.1 TPM domain-containing protein [Mucilaginibacter myungsuensis]MDN3597831.1 TPM domain-containing protein [Mucilaginibacter myungsuensis]